MNRVHPAEPVLQAKANEFLILLRTQTQVASASAAQLQSKAFGVKLVLVNFALVLGGVIAWRITVSVTAPIARAMVVVAERTAMGDLSL